MVLFFFVIQVVKINSVMVTQAFGEAVVTLRCCHFRVEGSQISTETAQASYVEAVAGKSRLEEEHGLPSYLETGSGNSLYSCYSLSDNGTIAHVCLSLVFFPRRCVCTCCTAAGPQTPLT